MNTDPKLDPKVPNSSQRLVSLDAFRGLVMLFMMSDGFGFAKAAQANPDSAVWQWLKFHTTHAAWTGGGAWDMIQPAFMLMVGMSLPYSLSRRLQEGEPLSRILAHTLWRSFLLVLLAIFLTTGNGKRPDFAFHNVLAQIGLGYSFVVLLINRGWKVQTGAIGIIAVLVWGAFVSYPLPGPEINLQALGVTEALAKDAVLPGLFAHWNMNTNFAAGFDRWFLNLFPSEKPFVFNKGGYQTLNFVPSIITMTLGLMAGELLRSNRSARAKLVWLLSVGAACISAGLLAAATVCPLIKRIWTPSWALYSGGIVLWVFASLYWAIDMRGWKLWTKPAVVVGMNSIAIYVIHNRLGGWIKAMGVTYIGQSVFDGPYGGISASLWALAVLWLFCWWLYQRKIFIKI
ncbi:MAG: DUF5009 domain-containing protein [Verrucomicrobia bacterium]|nr:DUF5009 domain-containing protein [Verrucomicrobiota bacterium]